MMLPTDAAMTTRRSSLSGTLDARIGLLCVRSVRRALSRGYPTESARLSSSFGNRRDLSLLFLILRLERRDDRRVGQRRGVAERSALGDVAQEPAHDLAAPRLRELRREDDVIGPRQGADLLHDVR